MDFRFDIIYEYRWMFLYGVLTTLGLTVVATAGGSVLGLLLALARLINPEKRAPMRAWLGCCVRFLLVCDAVSWYAIVCTNCDLGLCLVPIFRSPGRRYAD